MAWKQLLCQGLDAQALRGCSFMSQKFCLLIVWQHIGELLLNHQTYYCTPPDLGTQWPDTRRGSVVHNITLHNRLNFFGNGCIKCSFNLGRFFCLEMWGKLSIVWVCVRLLPLGRISELIRASSTKFCLFVIRSQFFEDAIPTFSGNGAVCQCGIRGSVVVW